MENYPQIDVSYVDQPSKYLFLPVKCTSGSHWVITPKVDLLHWWDTSSSFVWDLLFLDIQHGLYLMFPVRIDSTCMLDLAHSIFLITDPQKGCMHGTITISNEPHISDTMHLLCLPEALQDNVHLHPRRRCIPDFVTLILVSGNFLCTCWEYLCGTPICRSFPVCWPMITATPDLAMYECLTMCGLLLHPPSTTTVILQVPHGESHLSPLQTSFLPFQPQA